MTATPRRGRRVLGWALSITLIVPTLVPAAALGARTPRPDPILPPHAPGVVLVGLTPASAPAAVRELRSTLGVRATRPLSALVGDAERWEIAPGADLAATLVALRRSPLVRYAEPDYLGDWDETANDSAYTDGTLWAMRGAATGNQFGTGADAAWAAGYTGSPDVYVGLLDQGPQITHPDLAANVWTNRQESVNGLDDDANGYVDDANGWDFFGQDNSVYDPTQGTSAASHGTHTAGTLAGVGGNGVGVAGVGWRVGLIPLKIGGTAGPTVSAAIAALDYLTDLKRRHGLDIVAANASWNIGSKSSQALLDAINRGGDAGILFVVAAGNNGNNIDRNGASAEYPAANQCVTTAAGAPRAWDCVVTVAADDSSGALASFSNFGPVGVDLGAPGVNILSLSPGDSYAYRSGTSMAAPHVTGAIALCASMNPGLTAPALRSILLAATAPTASLAGKTVTGGRLDIGAMVDRCLAAGPKVTSFSPTLGLPGTPVTITGANFTTGTTVRFAGRPATTTTVVDSTTLTTVVPADATSGVITVATSDGTGASATPFLVAIAPDIASVSPGGAGVGMSVAIEGTGFTAGSTVTFSSAGGGTAIAGATTAVVSATRLTTVVPADATSGPLTVTTEYGSDATAFTLIPTPTITALNTASAVVGDTITITGTDLTGTTRVTFNGSDGTSVTVVDATRVTAVIPQGATSGPVTVLTPGGSATSGDPLTIVPVPTIRGFSPAAAGPGMTVVVTGTNFTPDATVGIGGVDATIVVVAPSRLEASVPAMGGSGPITVTTADGTATSASDFTFVAAPTIDALDPTGGVVGDTVTIEGAHLSGATRVTFNGSEGTNVTVIDDATISAVVPEGATSGPVAVVTPGGTATSDGVFTVVPVPTIATITPSRAEVGATLTIAGTNFVDGATDVTFTGSGGGTVPAVATVLDTRGLTVVVPAGARTGAVTVTTPIGSAAAPFTLVHELAVARAGSGGGSVVSDEGSISCGSTCTAGITDGTSVTLTATPAASSDFAGWSGACTGDATTCTLGLAEPVSVIATFTLKIRPLEVLVAGTGTGSVTSGDGTIACGTVGSSCSGGYTDGTYVTLRATPAAGSTFVGWSGACAGSSSTCTVVMNATRTTTATFLPVWGLTIVRSGSGTGSVTSGDGRISCGNGATSCAASYTDGSLVTLRATPAANATFSSWSAPCAETTGPCPVTLDQARTITATFTLRSWPLTVSVTGTGTGSVTSGDGTIACGTAGTSCTGSYTDGTLVRLTAVAGPNAGFAGWSGGCTGLNPICSVTMTAARTVAATFALANLPTVSSFTPTSGGVGTSVTVTGTNFAAGATCRVGATAAPCTAISTTQLILSIPTGATTGPLGIATAGGDATSATDFTVGTTPVAPTVSGFNPTSGVPGTIVVVTGTNLAGATAVKLGTVTSRSGWTVLSATQLQIAVDVTAGTGTVAVTTDGGTGTSTASFTVLVPPTLAATPFSPAAGPEASTVTISGSNLTGTTSVSFNGLAAASFSVVSATTISARVPAGATTGPVTITNPAASVTSAVPFTVAPLVASRLSAGTSHSCAVVADGTVRCWGANASGQLGTGNLTDASVATAVGGLTGAVGIAAGGAFTCVARTDGTARCWGLNSSGQLGDGSTTRRTSPVTVMSSTTKGAPPLGGIATIVAGATHTCALLTDGTARCWGANASGQLGNGTTTGAKIPVVVLSAASTPLTGIVALAAGGSSTCALLATGGVRCWGLNGNGQLGDGTTTNRTYATPVSGLASSGVAELAVGGTHACAELSGGTVRCWGLGTSGQLGDATSGSRLTPGDVRVAAAGAALTGVVSIAAGTNHTCAALADGTARCWGANGSGQLGNDASTNSSYPVTLAASGAVTSGIARLACGGSHTLALAGSGAFAWGLNTNGQLGDWTTVGPKRKAIRVVSF